MAAELRVSKEEVDDISLERVHRIGKSSPTDSKPGLPIAKFTYHKDKEFVLSHALNLQSCGRAWFSERDRGQKKASLTNFKRRQEVAHCNFSLW